MVLNKSSVGLRTFEKLKNIYTIYLHLVDAASLDVRSKWKNHNSNRLSGKN